MVASGLLEPGNGHAENLARMALDMQREARLLSTLELRIGIDIGPVVAGVIGRSKYIHDLWGDTVNTASRMESHVIPGTIQVTERAYKRLASAFEFEDRGMVEIKGKGPLRTYLLIAPRAESGPIGVARGRETNPRGVTYPLAARHPSPEATLPRQLNRLPSLVPDFLGVSRTSGWPPRDQRSP
jgi:hypothetical protein